MRRALCLGVLLVLGAPCAAQNKAIAVSGARYRAILEVQRQNLLRLEKRAPRDVRPVLKALERNFLIRRADGQTLQSDGDQFERILKTRDAPSLANLPGSKVRVLRSTLEARIRAFDAWNTPREGVFFLPADAKTIVSQLEASGEIRTRPLEWQLFIADIRAWIDRLQESFWDWFTSRIPKSRAPVSNLSEYNWLWPLFWVCVVSLLGAILFFALRALGVMEWISPLTRRRKKSLEEMETEDAALLRLPADELRERAQIFAENAQFREALRHRYLAVLVETDARGVWRYDTRRTNWEHLEKLREESRFSPLWAPFSGLTRQFDRVRYGGAPCDQSGWRDFEVQAQSLENQLAHYTILYAEAR